MNRPRSQSPTKGHGSNANLSSLPIMDEVNDLIEKEKYLLEFKVREQQKLAHEWKVKHDSLLDKISENVAKVASNSNAAAAVASAGYQVLEEAAVAEEKTTVVAFDEVTSNLSDFIYKTGEFYTLDMSGKPASFVISQLINGTQTLKRYASGLKTVFLSHCGLGDEHAAVLCNRIVANAGTDAIDLSFNNLGMGFEVALFETLVKRKRTPEYLHLQGNMALAASSSTFCNLLGVTSSPHATPSRDLLTLPPCYPYNLTQ